ncbi:Lipase-3 domain-containing protein [Mycena indigotica]|uniref:Lipase-3 domain-containing protein n=1 Tax=Mycena indigotica TaxID=2126181 RepID=A0A8H6W994_9AGAR|nr:Lipase-3 domain-containing protein [Mycena indigotica]KAF7309482.1 Lipase-3 domain-containing protein [Mycena indigotica]
MLALSTLLLLVPSVLSAPLFGINLDDFFDKPADSTTKDSPAISLDDVKSTLLRPAQFARAAYCSTKSLTSWTCGEPCKSLGKVNFLQSGGDEGLVPLYFIAHDPTDNAIVVSHEGTDSKNIVSIINDVKFTMADLNATRFPQFATLGVKVHSGFQDTFERTADGLLAGVLKALESTGVKKVSVTGHSLGAAVGTMTGLWLKQKVDPSVKVTVAGFGLPRGGNQAWADLLDKEVGVTFMTNQNDPVPTVPPLFLGFQHPQGEIHITDDSQKNFIKCAGQDNENCATGNSLLSVSVSNHKGPYFEGISFGHSACPEGRA